MNENMGLFGRNLQEEEEGEEKVRGVYDPSILYLCLKIALKAVRKKWRGERGSGIGNSNRMYAL
jgi:hypothetical protein